MEIVNSSFTQILNKTWCIKATVNIPVYFLNEKKVVLFDSGYKDERTRPYLDEIISKNNLIVRAVIGSHTHYDHIGNHTYLKDKYDAEIIMPEMEGALAHDYMMFAPVYGQYSKKELKEVFPEMILKPDRTIPQHDNVFTIDGAPFKAIDLKGHTPGHMGFITPDDVFYLADALMGEEVMAKSKLPTTLDWEEDLETKKRLLNEKHKKYIVAHGDIYDEIVPLAKANIDDRMNRINRIIQLIDKEDNWTVEGIQKHLWKEFDMKTKSQMNRRIFSRNVYYIINYLSNINYLESYAQDGIINYRVSGKNL